MRLTVAAFLAIGLVYTCPASELTLWYRQPARSGMNEALAIGNGHMGGLIYGAPDEERVNITEDSFWTGGENPSGEDGTMGSYQTFGDAVVRLPAHTNAVDYRRELDIGTALSRVRYEAGGVKHEREFFCSHPAGVLVARFSADKPGSYTGQIELRDSHGAATVVGTNRLTVASALENGLKYEWQIVILPEGGSVESNGTSLAFSRCDGFTLLIAAGTDYAMNYAKHYRGRDPHQRLTTLLEAASQKSYDALEREHETDFRSLFDRVALDLGPSSAAQRGLPTDQRRLEAFQRIDPELETLLFQYGRYLLISCSRPGGLPANLQGLWNDRNDPAWHSDYHANINVEMNYWPAEPTGLPECQLPFFNLVDSQLPAWRKATAASPEFKTPSGQMSARGFAIRTSHNIYGGMGWNWDKTANAWYCRHFWEHYEFTRDRDFLRRTAYPIMKETCEFWEDHLEALPDGRLVVPKGWSPEHGPVEDGVSYNQEIVWDLFDNYTRAADALGIDRDYRDKIAGMRDRLLTPGIGSWGQLLEWRTEKTNSEREHLEFDTRNDHHRHTSHLFAVYPGHQITPGTTPALAAAAKVSLDARGISPDSDVREWSFAWRTSLYARLGDGDDAHKMLQQLFSDRNTCPNLFGLHPPMQMDGNFGVTAGMAEMLVQSQDGEIQLLPALPGVWPEGSVKGLRARGGFEVDESWADSKLSGAVVRALTPTKGTVRYGKRTVDFSIDPGKPVTFDGSLKRTGE
jgi:alpha-L-fucosidase 2